MSPMSEISQLVYSPLMEEERQLTGWSKSTVDWVLKHKSRVIASIKGIGKSHGKNLQSSDVEDIHGELLQYLYNCDDYNIDKACTSSNTFVSLDGYVHSCIKYVTIRYVTKMYEYEGHTVRDIVKEDDGKELSLLDTITDNRCEDMLDSLIYQLDTICQSYEHQRYQLGVDVFQIWFIRLQTIACNKQDKYNDILTVLGISKRDIANVERNASRDGVMISIAKAVTLIDVNEALKILRRYTYCADKIARVISIF